MPDRYGDQPVDLDTDTDELWAARRRHAITSCDLCDDDGLRGALQCDHTDWAAIAHRGIAKVREALTKNDDQ